MADINDMVVVLYTAKAKLGKDKELRELFVNLVTGSRSDPGCVSYEVHEVVEDPSTFVLYEQWMSKELLASHLETPPLRELKSKAGDLMEGSFEAGMRHLKKLRP